MKPILWSLGIALALVSAAAWSAETRQHMRSHRPEPVPHNSRPMPPASSWQNRPSFDRPRPDRGGHGYNNGWRDHNSGGRDHNGGWHGQGNNWQGNGWQGNGWGNHSSSWDNRHGLRPDRRPSSSWGDRGRPDGVLNDRYRRHDNLLRDGNRSNILREPMADDRVITQQPRRGQ